MQMKFGYINSKAVCAALIAFFFSSIFAYANDIEYGLFVKAFRNDEGEIIGYEQKDNLFFFHIVGKKYPYTILLRNVRIEKKSCKIFYPKKKYTYENNMFYKKNSVFYKQKYSNMFDAKAFYYQFDEYRIFHKEIGMFINFRENYKNIDKCYFQ